LKGQTGFAFKNFKIFMSGGWGPHENFEIFKGKSFILSIFEEGRTTKLRRKYGMQYRSRCNIFNSSEMLYFLVIFRRTSIMENCGIWYV
jgi:hypothetical protein